ncbi:hypothetical protein KCU79_g47, partial [Aureobasidium melanogenum]
MPTRVELIDGLPHIRTVVSHNQAGPISIYSGHSRYSLAMRKVTKSSVVIWEGAPQEHLQGVRLLPTVGVFMYHPCLVPIASPITRRLINSSIPSTSISSNLKASPNLQECDHDAPGRVLEFGH